MKQTHFLHVDKNSQKLKLSYKMFLVGHGQKWVWLTWSLKIDCI